MIGFLKFLESKNLKKVLAFGVDGLWFFTNYEEFIFSLKESLAI